MKKLILNATLVAALSLAFTINAAEVYIDTGVDLDADADDMTDNFIAFGLFPDANSIYTERATSVACPACGTDGILKNGELLDFTDSGTVHVDALKPLSGLFDSIEGFGSTWGLNVTYSVSGVAQAVIGANIDMTTISQGDEFAAAQGLLPNFTAGTIEVHLIDAGNVIGTNGQKLLELDLVPPTGGADIANVVLDGILDYGWYAGGDSLVENMFVFADSGLSFYDLAGATIAQVAWRADFNVDPNLIPGNFSGDPNYDTGEFPGGNPFPGSCGTDEFCRASNLNMTVRFDPIPEPAAIALLGAGLLGLGGMRKLKKS